MPWNPEFQGETPTLGWAALDWMISNLAAPDRGEYEPYTPTQEQAQFLLDWYSLDPVTGRRAYRRGVISRPKGWGKSPFLGAIALFEALGPAVPDGWDANGRPVGRPWADTRTPLVQIAAVSEDQTANAWAPMLEMCRMGPVLDNYPGLEPLESFIVLPRGRIEPVTASSNSREGARPIFSIFDQTESWYPSNGGVKLANTMRRNLGKTGGTSIEAPNAYVPGLDSVSEATFKYWESIKEGRSKEKGLYVSHREAPADTDLSDRDSLLAGLAYAYGDSADKAGGWVDLERLVAEIWDPSTTVEDARQFYLSQITHAADAWVSQMDLRAIADRDKVVEPGESITMGFDGSRKRTRGITDATALVGCRVSDGHLFTLGVWEQPEGYAGRDWEVPALEVDQAVRDAFKTYNVVGFRADPALWESYIAGWEADFGKKLKLKSTQTHPIERYVGGSMQATTWVRAIENLENAIFNREITYDGSSVLTRHFLNARRRQSTRGVQLAKAFPDSPRKIDATIAAILAYEGRHHAVAQGLSGRRKSRRVMRV